MYAMYLFGYILFSFVDVNLNTVLENLCSLFCLVVLIFKITATWLILRISVLPLSGTITFCTLL